MRVTDTERYEWMRSMFIEEAEKDGRKYTDEEVDIIVDRNVRRDRYFGRKV